MADNELTAKYERDAKAAYREDMRAAEAERYAEQTADCAVLREGTCDCCAEGPKPIVEIDSDTEAYMCRDCWLIEEAAILAGANALHEAVCSNVPCPHSAAPYLAKARIVVAAYQDHYKLAAQNDGEERSPTEIEEERLVAERWAEETAHIDGSGADESAHNNVDERR